MRPVVLILCRGLVLVLGTLRAAGLAVRAGGGCGLLVCAAADSDREDCGDDDDDVFHVLVLGWVWLCCAADSADAGRGVSVQLAFKARRDGAAGRFFARCAGDEKRFIEHSEKRTRRSSRRFRKPADWQDRIFCGFSESLGEQISDVPNHEW